jgi:hypothetical protein
MNVNKVNDDLNQAFVTWKIEGYRDYDPMIRDMLTKGFSIEDAEATLYIAFMAGFDWPK